MTGKMLDLVARRFRTLGEPYRLRILQELRQARSQSVNWSRPSAGPADVSKHLQILSEAGLIGRRREGTSIFYAISDPMVFKLCALVCSSEAKKSRRGFEELAGKHANGSTLNERGCREKT